MQALWSRAGQVHRCGCRACDSAISGIGRRASTAARRRKPTFAEVFTACYSSVFATAAVVDAVRKEDRSQELDRQLDEARRELAELQQLRQSEITRAAANLEVTTRPELTSEQREEIWDTLKTIYKNRPFMKEIHQPVTLDASELLTRLQTDYYKCPSDATMQVLRRTDLDKLEMEIADEENRDVDRRDPVNRRQLHQDSRTVIHLVNQLLDRADFNDRTSLPSPSYSEARELARCSPEFTFRAADPVRARRNTKLLNSRLREIVSKRDLGLREKVGRVCYNLMVSPYPPDMHTYNTLIVAFDKTGHEYLSEAFVNSFFYYRRLKPTPSTLLAILNHYQLSGNHGRFLRTLACTTGADVVTGAKIWRRHLESVRDQDVKYWTNRRNSWTQTGDWIWEHAPITQNLIESLIRGLLHFKMFDEAAALLVSCARANITLDTKCIKLLLEECILALDWRAAVRLIRGFTDSAQSWLATLMNREYETAYFVNRLYVLLDICGLPSTNERTPSKSRLYSLNISGARFARFTEFLAVGHIMSQLHLTSPPGTKECSEMEDALRRSKSRLLQLESLWKEQALVSKTTKSIESKLLYPDFPGPFRRSMAQFLGEASIQASSNLSQEVLQHVLALDQSPKSQQLAKESNQLRRIIDSSAGHEPTLTIQTQDVVTPTGEEPMTKASAQESSALEVAEPVLSFRESIDVIKTGRSKTRPRRLLRWPLPEQRPVHSLRSDVG